MEYNEKQNIIANFKAILRLYNYFKYTEEDRKQGFVAIKLKQAILQLITDYLPNTKYENENKLVIIKKNKKYNIYLNTLGFSIVIEDKRLNKIVQHSFLNGEFILWLVSTFDEFEAIKFPRSVG